jgi:hypothetical protein
MFLKNLPQHHAILLVHANRAEFGETLWNELSSASPAHKLFNQTVLDIETARNIISWANTPYNYEKIALISFHTAGHAAQNAMLKILEEPRAGVRFILLTSNKSNVIDTILSRVLHFPIENIKESTTHAEEFLNTNPSTRMKLPFVIELLARVDEEKRKDREGVREFILSIAKVLSNFRAKPKHITESIEVASYASDSSASGKSLLEYLALLLPQTK